MCWLRSRCCGHFNGRSGFVATVFRGDFDSGSTCGHTGHKSSCAINRRELGIFDAQVTRLLVAPAGSMFAVSCTVLLASTLVVLGSTETPVTATTGSVTSTVAVALWLPSCETTSMVAVPTATPATLPFWSTVALSLFLEVQVTLLLVAFDGCTSTRNLTDFPSQRR